MSLRYFIKEFVFFRRIDNSLNGLITRTIKFLFSKTILQKFTNTFIYNKIYFWRIKKKIRKFRPEILSIENTNICNARCIMCPHLKMKRALKIMNQQDFEKIVENIMRNESVKYIIITGFGEPLIDKDIDRKIEFLNRQYDKVKVVFFTNAGLLTKQLTDRLLGLWLFKINFSVNGTKENYKEIMDLDYQETIDNIEYFLERKKRLGLKYPLVNISLMIINENKRDIKNFLNYWIKKADSVITFLPNNWGGGIESINVGVSFTKKRWPCIMLWERIAVDVDGNYIICCTDYESGFKIGNLLTEDYEKIKERMDEIKERHLKMDFSIPICNKCDYFSYSLDWW